MFTRERLDLGAYNQCPDAVASAAIWAPAGNTSKHRGLSAERIVKL